jgi:hypothetical protein
MELDVLNDLWQDLQSEFTLNEWPIQEGLRFTLAVGLAALRAERQRDVAAKTPQADLKVELDRLQRERMQIDGRYAVMKFRTYQFMQDSRSLAAKWNACRKGLEGLRQVNTFLRAEL